MVLIRALLKKQLNEIIIHCIQIFVPSEWCPDALDAEHLSWTTLAIFFSLLFFSLRYCHRQLLGYFLIFGFKNLVTIRIKVWSFNLVKSEFSCPVASIASFRQGVVILGKLGQVTFFYVLFEMR
jgi:hypothetical protein